MCCFNQDSVMKPNVIQKSIFSALLYSQFKRQNHSDSQARTQMVALAPLEILKNYNVVCKILENFNLSFCNF